MRNHRITTYLLLGYLALLLNVGPSAHHVDLFGLHASRCCQFPTVSNETEPSCCCDHDHAHRPELPLGSEKANELVASSDLNPHGSDCVLCQYFDNFNAVNSTFELYLDDQPARFRTPPNCLSALSRPIDCSARGPPSRLLS